MSPRRREAPVLRVVAPGGADVARWSLAEIDHPDLAAAEAIARLRVSVRPNGWHVVVQRPCERLRAALDLIGQSDVIAEAGRPRQAVTSSSSRTGGNPNDANSSGYR